MFIEFLKYLPAVAVFMLVDAWLIEILRRRFGDDRIAFKLPGAGFYYAWRWRNRVDEIALKEDEQNDDD